MPESSSSYVFKRLIALSSSFLSRAFKSPCVSLQDFGQTWENLTENSAGKIASFVDFEWGAMLKPWGNSTTNKDETIFATVYEDTKHLKGPLPNWVSTLRSAVHI